MESVRKKRSVKISYRVLGAVPVLIVTSSLAQEEDGPRPQVYGTLVHVGQGDTPHQRPILSLGPSPPRRAELGLTVEGPDGDLQTNPGESLGGLGGPDGLDGGGESGLARVAPSTLALSVVIVVGISFLLVNMCAFGFLYYKKNRLRVQQQFFRCDNKTNLGRSN